MTTPSTKSNHEKLFFLLLLGSAHAENAKLGQYARTVPGNAEIPLFAEFCSNSNSNRTLPQPNLKRYRQVVSRCETLMQERYADHILQLQAVSQILIARHPQPLPVSATIRSKYTLIAPANHVAPRTAQQYNKQATSA